MEMVQWMANMSVSYQVGQTDEWELTSAGFGESSVPYSC